MRYMAFRVSMRAVLLGSTTVNPLRRSTYFEATLLNLVARIDGL
jgi:hypothetical protein